MPHSRLDTTIRELGYITPNLSQLSLSDLSTFKPNGVDAWPSLLVSEFAGITSDFTNIELACLPLTWATLEELGKKRTVTWEEVEKRGRNPYDAGEDLRRLGRILPKLKRLALTGPSDMNYILVAEMVRSRWRDCDKLGGGLERLESVAVNAHTVMKPCTHPRSSKCITRSCHSFEVARALESLRLYRAEGLRLVIAEAECVECLEEDISRKRWPLEGK
ncbi:hypothetical protein FIBSPDRAFT_928048 [Athelia psychrophila]|uniref:Uncharacterized protein n=1 Tax=Athelia psychrophila TaxID=1759441 RepID=A0A166QTN0_9AGAM|nr:hypothetical protein FIBSPDRAFT_928048 [Fibularhizoctonia sp. CBS 109695]